jgi:hypothetical protein
MYGTNVDRGARRAQRWITRTGGLVYVSPEAFALLVRRLAARRRVAWWCLPAWLLAFVVITAGTTTEPTLGTAGWTRAFAPRALAGFGVVVIAAAVSAALNARADRRIGETLRHRVSRGTSVSVWTVLGPARVTYALVAFAVDASLGLAIVALQPGWLVSTYLSGLLAVSGFVIVGVWQAASRATLAVDPVSLAIDERLRSEDAFAATSMLTLLLLVIPSSALTNARLEQVWLVALVGVACLQLWAYRGRPWRTAAGPAAPYLAPPQPGGAG